MIERADFSRLLDSQQGKNDAARILKAWRSLEHLSQAQAAARLGVSVRTLQGWELGRPMPHPGLLQIGTTASRANDPLTLGQSEFPREFARFVDFVGGTEMMNALHRADTKLASLLPQTRQLYKDRFYFHQQFVRFSEGPMPFRLDLGDPIALRAASLISGVNWVRDSLSREGSKRLKKMILGNLRPDRDIRQLEHEIRCASHFGRRGFKVTFADLEGLGRFDLVVDVPSGPIEVECKTVSDDTGSQIKLETTINLMDVFLRNSSLLDNKDRSVIFILRLKRSASACKDLVPHFKEALRSGKHDFDGNDFTLTIAHRPQWNELLKRERIDELRKAMSLDADLAGHASCFTRIAGSIVALSVQAHKPNDLSLRVVEVIKDGAKQCAGDKPSVVWLHFIGAAEAEFKGLATFSMNAGGAGLNSLVAKALHPRASTTDRSHVQSVLFSASGEEITRTPTVGRDLLIVRAASTGGLIYEVRNPFCRFSQEIEM